MSTSCKFYRTNTWSECSENVWIHCLVEPSQIRTVWSAELDTKCSLSGEKATDRTQLVWPDNVPTNWPWFLQCILRLQMQDRVWLVLGIRGKFNNLKITYTSYIFIWQSSEPVSNLCESGEKVNDLIGIACPSRVCINFEDSTSNTLIIPSIAPDATYFPSGD